MVTKFYKVYGKDGHRQKMSFGKSMIYDFFEKWRQKEWLRF